VLVFAVAVSIVTAAIFGVGPAILATRRDVHERVKDGGRTATSGRRRHHLRNAMVVAEVALSLVLLVGAGLLVRSFVSLLRVDRGFRGDGVLAVTVQAWDFYKTGPQRIGFVREALGRIGAIAGVEAVGVTSSLPLAETIGLTIVPYTVGGNAPLSDAETPKAHVTVATPGYFDALRIGVRRGRGFSIADDERSAPVALVNEAFVRRWFPDRDPIGERVTLGFMGAPVAREIVGVVADVRQTGLAADPAASVFLPHAQAPTGALTFTVQTRGDPAQLIDPVKRQFQAMNGAMPVASATTLDALLASAVRERRFHLSLLGAFAWVALLLAGVGIYGVLSSAVGERHQEFGVRLALGAKGPDILALVAREGALLVAGGIGLGLGLAAVGVGVLREMLFRVSPRDPLTFAAVIGIVVVAAVVAVVVPARRAAALDPLDALRDG
jgi:putative ABC transport system permease protein